MGSLLIVLVVVLDLGRGTWSALWPTTAGRGGTDGTHGTNGTYVGTRGVQQLAVCSLAGGLISPIGPIGPICATPCCFLSEIGDHALSPKIETAPLPI